MKTLVVSLVFLLLCFSGIITFLRNDNDTARSSDDQSWIGLTKTVFVIGEWQPYLKTVNNCTNFRNASTPALFKIWPESSGKFCCEDRQSSSNSTIASYVHSARNGRFLHPIPYYDVGIVTDNQPYWTTWRLDRISQTEITHLVFCEVNDLKKFYVRRFWLEALAKQGLLFSAAPSILLVELLVLFSGLWKRDFRKFPWFLWPEKAWDLVHLCLLGVNGSLLMENVGHSDPCGWEAVLLFNSAVVYTYLTALSVLSAVLHQVALWSGAHTIKRLEGVEEMDSQGKESIVMSQMDPSKELVKSSRVETDWQLQRMSAQGAVFFVASLYCTFVTVYSRDEFVAWLLGIIILALVWSCSVGLAMLCKDVKFVSICYQQRRAAKAEERKPKTDQQQSGADSASEDVQTASKRRLTRSTTL